jgi:hypothetical protein
MVALDQRFLNWPRKVIARLAFFALVFRLEAHRLEAHRLDEYLQAALIDIKSGEASVQLYLTPGVEVAEDVLRLIDTDRDGRISAGEESAYAKEVLKQLAVQLDDDPVKLVLLRTAFDPIPALKNGTGNIVLEMRGFIKLASAGRHILSFENRHQPKMSVYLVNAVLPKDPAIQILKQERNENQSAGRISFSFARR